MNDSAFTSLADRWRQLRPELAAALPYLGAAERDCCIALACLEQQWVESVYGIAETDVALAKLGWWLEELGAGRGGHGRHPLSKVLFAGTRAREFDAGLWTAPVEAGMALRDAAPCSDFAAQLALGEPFHGALARLENALWFGPGGASARAGRLATLGHLLDALGHLHAPPHAGAMPLPMNVLARHRLPLGEVGQASPARRAALRDQLDALDQAWCDAQQLDGPVTLFRSLGARSDRRQLQRARRARDPLRVLATGAGRVGPGNAWAAWRAARRWRAG